REWRRAFSCPVFLHAHNVIQITSAPAGGARKRYGLRPQACALTLSLTFYIWVLYGCVGRLGDGRVAVDRSELLQGTLDMLILKIVALGPVHGYGISQRIQQVSREVLQVQQGSLYPALHRLEKRGWLAATWGESESGRQAKFYRLSAKGRKQLQAEESQWKRLSEAIGLILRTAD